MNDIYNEAYNDHQVVVLSGRWFCRLTKQTSLNEKTPISVQSFFCWNGLF